MVYASFPEYHPEYTVEDSVQYPVSFNGKTRFVVDVPASLLPKEVEARVLSDERTERYLDGGTVVKVIVVPGRIVNVVLKK